MTAKQQRGNRWKETKQVDGMELPKIKKSEHGMLDGLKSKLGFAEADQGYRDGRDYDYDDQAYGDDYGSDYGEYGSDYDSQGGYTDSGYGSYGSVSTRSADSRHQVSTRPAGYTPAKLVSIDDVKARTQIPDSLNRDPLPARRTSSYRGDRMMVDSAMPVSSSSPNARAAAAQDRERSESLNNLFTPTSSASADSYSSSLGSSSLSTSVPSLSSSLATSGAVSPSSRSIVVLKPAVYGEAERVATCLKKGDVVVLALRNTPENLYKRVLDFSFGVSCALDANVDCIAEKVFVITRGADLSDSERISLRNQGVL